MNGKVGLVSVEKRHVDNGDEEIAINLTFKNP
jgi:hypothetical protein